MGNKRRVRSFTKIFIGASIVLITFHALYFSSKVQSHDPAITVTCQHPPLLSTYWCTDLPDQVGMSDTVVTPDQGTFVISDVDNGGCTVNGTNAGGYRTVPITSYGGTVSAPAHECVPAPDPTPTPCINNCGGGVGGITQLPEVKTSSQESTQPSRRNSLAPFVAATTSAVVIVISTGTWVFRRRRSTR